ncbi:MAG: leucine-rich repeat protein [Clostridia bacterium]|nr:leucine-rich repeat protein [Clostridia bacterium]
MRKCTSAVLCAILLAACLTAGNAAVSAVVPEDGVILSDSMTGETAEASFPSDFQWNYDADTKTLTLSGTGYVNVNPLADMPWVDVNNEIEHIVLEEGITGYYQSFSGDTSAPTMYKSVKTLSVPSTLNSFSVYIPTLEKYTAAEGGCFYCADDVLYRKDGEETVLVSYPRGKSDLTSFTVPEGVTTIQNGGLQNEYLREILLPDTLTTLQNRSLGMISAATLHIPASVTEIDPQAFAANGNMMEYTVAEDNPYFKSVDGCIYDIDQTILYAYPLNSSRTEYTVSEGVTRIPDDMLRWKNALDALYLPTTLETVVVTHCSNGRSPAVVEIAEGNPYLCCVDNILYSADMKTMVHYPNGKTETEFTIPDTVETFAEQCFMGCPIRKLYLGSGITDMNLDQNWFYNASRLYFQTEPPAWLQEATEYDMQKFYRDLSGLYLCYPEGTEGWETPTWTSEAGVTYNTAVIGTEPEPESGSSGNSWIVLEEEDRGNIAFGVKRAQTAWSADGVFTEGEYHLIDVQDTWISAVSDNAEDAETAKALDFTLAMSWDDQYLYSWISYTDPDGEYVITPELWNGSCVQFGAADVGAADSNDRLEIGIAMDAGTGEEFSLNWSDRMGSGFMADNSSPEDFCVTVDGAAVSYELRVPFTAISEKTPEENAQYALAYVLSWGNGGSSFSHTQLASGISGGKNPADFATVTLEENWEDFENVQWRFDKEDGTLYVRGDGAVPSLSRGEDYPWIGHAADIRTLVLQEGITSYPYLAFRHLANGEFFYAIETVYLPSTLIQHSDGINSGNHVLQNVFVTPGGKYYDIDGVLFSETDGEVTLEIYPNGRTNVESYTVPENVQHLQDMSFFATDVAEVILQEGLLTIGDSAFYSANIEKLVLPASLTTIGHKGIQYNRLLEEIVLAEGSEYFTTLDGVLYTKDMKTLAAFPCGWPGEEFTIPNGVETIPANMFRFAFHVKNLNIPASVVNIEDTMDGAGYTALEAFHVDADNPSWSSVDGVLFNKDQTLLYYYPSSRPDTEYMVPDTVTEIEETAFYMIHNLQNLIMGKNVETLEWYRTFYAGNAQALTTVTFQNAEVPAYMHDADAFSYIRDKMTLYVPASSAEWTTPTWTNDAGVTFNTARYSSFMAAEADRGINILIDKAQTAWTADGIFTAGEYHTIDVQNSWVSGVASADLLGLQAKNLDFDLAMSWDDTYLYTWISYTDPNGYLFTDENNPSFWDGSIVQFAGAEYSVGEQSMNFLEVGFGVTSDTGEERTIRWNDYLGSSFMGANSDLEDFCAVVDGDTVSYEFRVPISAFSEKDPAVYAQYKVSYALSWGNGGGEYALTQLGDGIAGGPKDPSQYAGITLIDTASGADMPVKGDITGDGKVTASDLSLLQQYYAGYPTEINIYAVDFDGNGKLTRKDVMILARYLAGWDGYDQYFR